MNQYSGAWRFPSSEIPKGKRDHSRLAGIGNRGILDELIKSAQVDPIDGVMGESTASGQDNTSMGMAPPGTTIASMAPAIANALSGPMGLLGMAAQAAIANMSAPQDDGTTASIQAAIDAMGGMTSGNSPGAGDSAGPGGIGGSGSGTDASGNSTSGVDGNSGIGPAAAYANGGHVNTLLGPDPDGPDDGFAALDMGEFVIKAKQVKRIGLEQLKALNAGKAKVVRIK